MAQRAERGAAGANTDPLQVLVSEAPQGGAVHIVVPERLDHFGGRAQPVDPVHNALHIQREDVTALGLFLRLQGFHLSTLLVQQAYVQRLSSPAWHG